jgi:hypothetical protein
MTIICCFSEVDLVMRICRIHAAQYVRISTEEQAYSIENRKAAIRV